MTSTTPKPLRSDGPSPANSQFVRYQTRNVDLPKEIGELDVGDGRKLKQLKNADLARLGLKLGIAGVSHELGRDANRQLVGAHLVRLAANAGDEAWVKELSKK